MARASIPNVLSVLALSACGSAEFYDEVPVSDEAQAPPSAAEPADEWLDVPALGPGPRFDDGFSCEDKIAIARARVLRGLEAAKGLGHRDRQRCLADKAQLLATLAALVPDEGERTCRTARKVFQGARRCGASSPSVDSAALEHSK